MNDYNQTSTNNRHRNLAGECIVLMLGAMLASCGGGGGNSPSPPPVSPGPSPAPVPPPPPPASTTPPLASPAIDLATVDRVGVDRWGAYNTDTGGKGDPVQGVPCLPDMDDTYHVHTHLGIYLNGEAVTVPEAVGIVPGPVSTTGTRCFYEIHTHDLTGKVHVEAAEPGVFTLGNFFAIWGQPFNNTSVGDITGLPIVVYSVDDNVVSEVPDDEWDDIELTSKRQIVIQIGTPLTEIPNYTWTGD